MTSQQQRCDLGRGGSEAANQMKPHQGEKVGVADLGVLSCYPEMSDAAAGDTGERVCV